MPLVRSLKSYFAYEEISIYKIIHYIDGLLEICRSQDGSSILGPGKKYERVTIVQMESFGS